MGMTHVRSCFVSFRRLWFHKGYGFKGYSLKGYDYSFVSFMYDVWFSDFTIAEIAIAIASSKYITACSFYLPLISRFLDSCVHRLSVI